MIADLIQTLLQSPPVTAIVGQKVFPQVAEQTAIPPYITLFVVSDVPDYCKEGIAGETLRVQLNAIGRTYAQKETLYRAIKQTLDGLKTEQATYIRLTAGDLYREEGDAYGKAIDYQLTTNLINTTV